MTWAESMRWCVVGMLALACGPSSSSDDGGGSGSTADDGGSGDDDGSNTDDSGGGECPPNSVYAVPGCDDPMGFGVVPLPGEGCYEVCEDGDDSQCSVGACVTTSVNPCVGQPCEACGAQQFLCIPGEPLTPGFEADLSNSGGCGIDQFGVWAANADGDIVLGVSVSAGPLGTAQTTMTTQQLSATLPSADASVYADLGPDVAGNQCNDAPLGTTLRHYEATSGTVDITADPPTVGAPDSDQGIVTIVLADVVLEDAQGVGDPITVASYTFEMVGIWCCPG